MDILEIEDFSEDVEEGQEVTLLLVDGTQEIGFVRKIRKSSIKIERVDEVPAITLGINFADIRRYAVGRYDFLQRSLHTPVLSPNIQQQPNVSVEPLVAPVHPPQHDKESQATTTKQQQDILNVVFESFQNELSQLPDLQKIIPEFKIKGNLSYTVERELQQVMSNAKNQYDSANKLQEMTRLNNTVSMIDKSITQHSEIAQLYALKGALLWQLERKKEALTSLKKAVFLSDDSRDWLNVSIAADTSALSAYALELAFNAQNSIPFNINTWKFYIKKIFEAKMSAFIGKTFCLIIGNATEDEQLQVLKRSLVFTLKSLKKDETSYIHILSEKENLKTALENLAQKYFSDQTTIPQEAQEIRSNIVYYLNEEKKIFLENTKASDEKEPDILTKLEDNSNQPSTGVGYVYQFSPNGGGWSGFIKDVDTNHEYFFYGDHVQSLKLLEAFQKQDFSYLVSFSIFLNNRGLKQAGHINSIEKNVTPTKLNFNQDFPKDVGETFTKNMSYKSIIPYGEREINEKALIAIKNKDRNKAIDLLEQGVSKYDDSTVLWLLLAQQYSAMQDTDNAAKAYKKLIFLETKLRRFGALKNAQIQYIQLLAKGGEHALAQKEALALKKHYKDDELINQLNSNIQLMAQTDDDLAKWSSGFETDISQFLKKELEQAEFYDEQILASGGQPSPEDAARLMSEAIKNNKTSEGRYFTSLQAAKAYSMLPVGSYELDSYHQCLSNYAMQKGEYLVNRMMGLARTSDVAIANSEILSILSDSAASYFIEALSLLPVDNVKNFGASIIKNYLFSQILKLFSEQYGIYDKELLQGNFNTIFKKLLNPREQELFIVACNSILTWGSYPEVWYRLQRVQGGPGALTSEMSRPTFKQNIKIILSELLEQDILDERPGEILRFCFKHRKDERQDLQAYFRAITSEQPKGNFEFFRIIKDKLDSFPLDNKALLKTDKDMLKQIKIVINGMMKYREASDDERTDILVRARQGVEDRTGKGINFKGFETLLQEIKDAPTYWKLVGCEALILQSLSNINQMEKVRTQKRLPNLVFSLEPSTFQLKDSETLQTVLCIKNEGIVSATETKIFIKGSVDSEKNTLFEYEFFLGRIEPKSSDTKQEIRIPYEKLKMYSLGEPQLLIEAHYSEGQTNSSPITIEIDREANFTANEIPWRYAGDVTEKTFKGRDDILRRIELALNTRSERAFSYMLYGVTRSGKTSILKFLLERVHGKKVLNDPKNRIFLCINLAFNDIATFSNTNAIWKNFLYDEIEKSLDVWSSKEKLAENVRAILPNPEKAQGENFHPLIASLQNLGVYPVFLIDEFSFYRTLHDKGLLGASFLSLLREFALNDYATSIFAGTYDLLELIKDEKYGITGQFVNLKKEYVTSINEESARELINIFDEKLHFTDGACKHIIDHSDCRPYIIQTICQFCAKYALAEKRSTLGTPEVEKVIATLAGETPLLYDISALEATHFDNNLIFSKEKKYYYFAAITSLLSIEGHSKTSFLAYENIKSIWVKNSLMLNELTETLDDLCDRDVIARDDDEGVSGYFLKVGLFRRWWRRKHPNLDKELDAVRN